MSDPFDILKTPPPESDPFSVLKEYVPPKPKTTLGDRASDLAVSAVKGAIGLSDMGIGLLDVPTGGKAGKLAEQLGYRSREANQILDQAYSPAQQKANQEVYNAEGFIPTLKAVAENPSVIPHQLVQNTPTLLGGGAISRGVMKLAPKLSPLLAGAIGEGAATVGQNLEQTRQQLPNGELDTLTQTAPIAASGVLTGAIAAASGGLANKLGLSDVQQLLTGVPRVAKEGAKFGAKDVAKNLVGTALNEGLQEGLQSPQEQVAQNYAQGLPLTQGAGNAAALGAVTGAVMGVGGAVIDPSTYRPEGPLSRAIFNNPVAQPVTNTETGQSNGQRNTTDELQNAPSVATPTATKSAPGQDNQLFTGETQSTNGDVLGEQNGRPRDTAIPDNIARINDGVDGANATDVGQVGATDTGNNQEIAGQPETVNALSKTTQTPDATPTGAQTEETTQSTIESKDNGKESNSRVFQPDGSGIKSQDYLESSRTGRENEIAIPTTTVADQGIRNETNVVNQNKSTIGKTNEEETSKETSNATEETGLLKEEPQFSPTHTIQTDEGETPVQNAMVTEQQNGDKQQQRKLIADYYANALHEKKPDNHNGTAYDGDNHYDIADAIINKDAYKLKHLANGLNNTGKEVFSHFTGIKLPKQQGATWKAIMDWAGVSENDDNIRNINHKINISVQKLSRNYSPDSVEKLKAFFQDKIDNGFNQIITYNNKPHLANPSINEGIPLKAKTVDLAKQLSELHSLKRITDETKNQPIQVPQDSDVALTPESAPVGELPKIDIAQETKTEGKQSAVQTEPAVLEYNAITQKTNDTTRSDKPRYDESKLADRPVSEKQTRGGMGSMDSVQNSLVENNQTTSALSDATILPEDNGKRARKLTEKTKYTISNDGKIAYIYAKKLDTDKFEKAFIANTRTIDFIQKNGIKSAIDNNLLSVYRPQEPNDTTQANRAITPTQPKTQGADQDTTGVAGVKTEEKKPDGADTGQVEPKQPWQMTAKEFGVPQEPKDVIVNRYPKLEAIAKTNPERLSIRDKEILEEQRKQKKAHSKYLKDHAQYLPIANQHFIAVQKAIYENKPVPAEVLNDYPDLQTKQTNESKIQTVLPNKRTDTGVDEKTNGAGITRPGVQSQNVAAEEEVKPYKGLNQTVSDFIRELPSTLSDKEMLGRVTNAFGHSRQFPDNENTLKAEHVPAVKKAISQHLAELAKQQAKVETKKVETKPLPTTQENLSEEEINAVLDAIEPKTEPVKQAAQPKPKKEQKTKAAEASPIEGVTPEKWEYLKKEQNLTSGYVEKLVGEGITPERAKEIVNEVNELRAKENTDQKVVDVDGVKVYQDVFRGEPVWMVQTQQNKEEYQKGVDRRFGDSIHKTIDEAKKVATIQARNNKYSADAKVIADKEASVAAEKKLEKENIDGFADDLPAMQKGKIISTLNKDIRIDGKVDSLKNHVKELIAKGEKPNTTEENKIKEPSRRAWNNMDNNQQRAHEKRVNESGKKTVYYVGDYELGKTAYDYANHLIVQEKSHVPETDFGNIKPETTPPTPLDQSAPKVSDKQAGIKTESIAERIKRRAEELKPTSKPEELEGKKLPSPKEAKEFVIEHIKSSKIEDYKEAEKSADTAFRERFKVKPLDVFDSGNMFRSDDFTSAVHDGMYQVTKERGEALPVPVRESDVSRERFQQAFSGTSHSPEERGNSQVESYVQDMVDTYESLDKLAKTPEQKQILNEEFADYKAKYIDKLNAYMSAHSRVMSTMITGPANFPVRSNEKKSNTADKRMGELVEWEKKAKSSIEKKIINNNRVALTPLEEAKKNLAQRERSHEIMKAVNLITRNSKLTEEQKIASIVEKELLTEDQAVKIFKPDFAGRIGFASYSLTNNNAEIKRLQQRVKELEAKQIQAVKAETDGNKTYTFEGGKVELNYADDRVRIFHDEKPSREVIASLKSSAFKWSPTNQAWQRQITDNAINAALKLTGAVEVKPLKTGTDGTKFSQSTPVPNAFTPQELTSYIAKNWKSVKADLDSGDSVIFKNINVVPDNILRKGEVLVHGEWMPSIEAWRGGLRDYNSYDSSHIGEGAGGSQHGHGIYFNTLRSIGEWYRDAAVTRRMSPANLYSGDQRVIDSVNAYDMEELSRAIVQHDKKRALNYVEDKIDQSNKFNPTESKAWNDLYNDILSNKVKFVPHGGVLSKVTIAPEESEFLNWDKPINEQSDVVKRALQGFTGTGGDVYKALTKDLGSSKAASDWLLDKGVRGNVFEDKKSNSKDYVVFSDKDVEIAAKYAKQQQPQGFYLNGKTYFLSDALNRDNVDSTIVHEYFHKALAQYPKLKERLTGVGSELNAIFEDARSGKAKGEYATIYNEAAKRVANAETPAKDAQEEWLAYSTGEYAKNPRSLPDRLRIAFRKLIAIVKTAIYRATGFIYKPTPADLTQFAIQAMGRNVVQSPVFNQTAMASMDKALPDAININGIERSNPDVRFSVAMPSTITNAVEQGDKWLSSFLNQKNLDTGIYNLQDRFIDLKRQLEKIVKTGRVIPEEANPYLAEEVYHQGRAYKIQQFTDNEVNPLLTKLHDSKIPLEKFEQFLHARHAPSRNAEMERRNPNQEIIDANLEEAKDKLAQAVGDKEQAEARREVDKWGRAQAFDGTEEQRLSLSGLTDKQVSDFMDSLSEREMETLTELGDMVDKITRETLDLQVKYGMEKPETIQALKDLWEHYVPLHRDEAHPEQNNFGQPIGKGFSISGSGMMQATGSNADVTHILAHLIAAREQMITRGEKNKVNIAMANFIKAFPDDEFAKVGKPDFHDKLVNGLVETVRDPIFVQKQRDNVVMMRIDGKDIPIVFNENKPENIRLALSLKNMDGDNLDLVESFIGKGTRFMASMNTQYNLVFGLFNMMRDTQGMALNLSSTELHGKQKQVLSYMPEAIKTIFGVTRKQAGVDPVLAKRFDEFNNAGATTGFSQMFKDIQSRDKFIEQSLKEMDYGKIGKSALWIKKALSDFNTVMENGTRFAVYMAARDAGLSTMKSASLAKNVTVNFNRKGAYTTKMGAFYAFFNASMQGTARTLETLSGPQGKKILMGGVALGAITTLVGIAAMGGDDWERIPLFIRERSLILPTGKKSYISIPMPLGFHILPSIGRVFVESFLGNDIVTPQHRFLQLTGSVTSAFNPLGGGDISSALMPSIADPALSLWRNRSWNGMPIYKEDYNSLKPTPGFTRKKDSTPEFATIAAKLINMATGGTEAKQGLWSPTGDQIAYVLGEITGGTGREIVKAEQVIESAITGEELPSYKIPLIGKLYGATTGNAAESSAYHDNLIRMYEHEAELKYLKENKRTTEAREYLENNPEARLLFFGKSIEKAIDHLQKKRKIIKEKGGDTKIIDKLITEKMKTLNNKLASIN